MDSKPKKYVLRGGRAGYDRLLVLARDRWPDTAAMFQRTGVRPGMKCLDLGCGSGEVTLGLAEIVGPGGSATGIDMNDVNLELARAAAATRGIRNVEFLRMDVNRWDDPDAFDLVYSRALVQHLLDPIALVHRMWTAARAGGVLAIEDADFEGWFCDPPNEGFAFFVRAYSEVLRRHGGDPTAGRKLRRYFRDVGIPEAQFGFVQPMRYEGEAKSLAWSTLEASSEAILAAGVATPSELRSALEDLAGFTEDPQSLISGPRMFQAWVRRPAAA
ncbi:MAG TPA: methyltransferase domain-containing protein [Thermoplasmata archaeon]|nr:methyltransferase domain-containing protein [Thermoplasmata archaeon]